MVGRMGQHPGRIIRMIGRQAEFGPGAHGPREAVEGLRRDDAPLVVTRLGPGIGKQDEDPVEAGGGQGVEQQARVVIQDADIAQSVPLDARQQVGDAFDKGLAAEKADLGIAQGLPGEMVARAEADLEPDLRDGGGKQRGRMEAFAGIGQGDRHGGQLVFEQLGARGAQGPPLAPAVKPPNPAVAPSVVAVRQRAVRYDAPKADFNAATRSVRSQEKPPSASGARPKWP